MKTYRLLLFVGIGLMTILVSCKDKTQYCPAYPQDETDYLPVDFIGQTLRYVFDDDTIAFNVLSPEFSEKYEYNPSLESACTSQAWQKLESNDKILSYTVSSTGHYILLMRLYDSQWFYEIFDIYDRTGYWPAEILPQWTAPTGVTYKDILKKSKKYKSDAVADTLYLSQQYGLVHWVVPSERHSFTLLP